eukprot:m.141083 g.141083  ORF g.141083 m.141083 type:complete len:362 (-) comp15971_c0_seq24:911-1996(-)
MKLLARYALLCSCIVVIVLVFTVMLDPFSLSSTAHVRIRPPPLHNALLICPHGFYISPSNASCQPCPSSHFTSPPYVIACRQMLDCSDISTQITHLAKFSAGGVKTLFKGSWRHGGQVIVARPWPQLLEDFQMGFKNLQQMGHHPLVVQPIGYCEDPPALVFPLYRHGSALNVNLLAQGLEDVLEFRGQLIEDYASILVYLHHQASSEGSYVMCDAITVDKLLSQFLISDDYRLILNDVDALPLATGKTIKCGHRQLSGDFVAPEQRWPHPNRPFDDAEMPPYDEKVDIWRVPETITALLDCDELSRHEYCAAIRPYLAMLRGRCKRLNPETRPDARWVLDTVRKLRYVLKLQEQQRHLTL